MVKGYVEWSWSRFGAVLSVDWRREDIVKKWKVLGRGDGYVGEKMQVEMNHVTINAIGVSRHSVKLRRCGITGVGHSVSIRTYTLNECKHIVRAHVELIPNVEERRVSGGLESKDIGGGVDGGTPKEMKNINTNH